MTRRLGVLTTGRQDWGVVRSTCRRLKSHAGFHLELIVGGMHLSDRFGYTVRLIEEDGFQPAQRLPWIDADGSTPAFDQAGRALSVIGALLTADPVEALLMVGDRLETAAAAVAATLARVPLVHLHGGEETEGAFDNNLRHAITKLSHLHLVSHPEHAQRVITMGEDPATVHIVGAPGLDNLHRDDLATREELQRLLRLELKPPVVLVTLHPATLGDDPGREAAAVLHAMDEIRATYVITLPNADPGSAAIREALVLSARKPGRVAVEALGERRYWGLMRLADAILGNSSSALIEAPALRLPAVNVGLRQRGRVRGDNVVDAVADGPAVVAALRQALTAEFRAALDAASAPFGDGHSAEQIVRILETWSPPRPPVKRFPARR